ncbi:MAG: hypothetical protein AB8B96_10415, partial [Lysobacterales bacterium]
ATVYTLTVAGLGGNAHYEQRFASEAEQVHSAISAGAQDSFLTGLGATRKTVLAELGRWSSVMSEDDSALIVLIGHGSVGGDEYRFNVAGPDITGAEIQQALDALPARRQLLVNTTSASGALLEALTEKPGRVVITSTKNGRELQATRFSTFFAQALSTPSADLDKDRRISAAEAFDFADAAVADYFRREGLLATEHPRQVGADPKAMILARLSASDANAADNAIDPELLARRQTLNEQISALRARREQMEQSQYLTELQTLLVELSRVSAAIEAAGETP